jgi:hypothetical protein
MSEDLRAFYRSLALGYLLLALVMLTLMTFGGAR